MKVNIYYFSNAASSLLFFRIDIIFYYSLDILSISMS